MAEEPKTKIKLTTYKVERCGFYKHGQSTPEFGPFHATCSDLFYWLKEDDGKALSETITAGDTRTSPSCLSIEWAPKSARMLLTLWNPVQTRGRSKNAVLSVEDACQVGNWKAVRANEPKEGERFGYPTYFWIDPEQGLIHAVTTGAWKTGHENMKIFFIGFLKHHSRHVNVLDIKKESLGNNHYKYTYKVEYRENPNEKYDGKIRPMFRSRVKRSHVDYSKIREHRADITKVIRKSSRSTLHRRNDTVLTKIFREFKNQFFKLDATSKRDSDEDQDDEHFMATLDVTPSENMLNELIEEAEYIEKENLSWDNIGVQFKGNNSPDWLVKPIARTERDIPLELEDTGIFHPQRLLTILDALSEQGKI